MNRPRRNFRALDRMLAMRWLELRVPPFFVWVVFAGAMFGVARLVPTPTFKLPGASVQRVGGAWITGWNDPLPGGYRSR